MQSNLEATRLGRWRAAKMYHTIDELYSAPNQLMSSVNIDESISVRHLVSQAHARQGSRWQCERRHLTINELYKAPNFTPNLPRTKIINQPDMASTRSTRQSCQFSQLNLRFTAMESEQLSWTGKSKQVVQSSVLHDEQTVKKHAPQSKMFPMLEELDNARNVPKPPSLSSIVEVEVSNDAMISELQEIDLVIEKNGLESSVQDVFKSIEHARENYVVHALQESTLVKENKLAGLYFNYDESKWKDGNVHMFDVDNASDIVCCQCVSGDKEDELVLCDSCALGYHTFCARPILPCVPIGPWICSHCSGPPKNLDLSESGIMKFFRIEHFNSEEHASSIKQTGKKRKRGKRTPWAQNSRKQWLTYVPSKDKSKRLEQLDSLAGALRSSNIKFANDLVYAPHMNPKSANQAALEKGEVQILQKGNAIIWEMCKSMHHRGECPPLKVIYDNEQGYMVIADDPIEDKTFICEYTGLVDFSKNREIDDSNSSMDLLITNDEYKDLVICQDEYGNVSHFLSGINNHKKESKKKQNCTFIRCSINGECHIFIVSIRRIKVGEALYCNYNAGVSINAYPTQNFV